MHIHPRLAADTHRVRPATLRAAASLTLTIALLIASIGCTTTVRPPDAGDDPIDVALLDHGRHASLVLPTGDGAMTRWAYGERGWYAENKTGLFQAAAALLWPTPAALGRRDLPGPVTEDDLRLHVAVPIYAMWIIRVDRARALALQTQLHALYQQHADTQLANPRYDLVFVDHPEPYSYFHNSNQMVAAWLRELGCDVQGSALTSSWRVELSAAKNSVSASPKAHLRSESVPKPIDKGNAK